MSNGHTPGPWNNHQGDDIYCVYAESGKKICSIEPVDIVGWNAVHREEADANEALIAAAPDLFVVALCEEALDMPHNQAIEILERYGWSHADRFERPASEFVRDLRRAAIAKARGTAC